MNDKTRDKERLKTAIGLLGKRQTANYTKQCRGKNLTTLTRLNIATSLFDDDNQNNKFAELVGKCEGFIIPRACKGICRDCKAGSGGRCPHYVETDAITGDKLTIRHKRKKQGD